MGVLRSSGAVCPREKHCSEWARLYMKYCLCEVKDWVSLSLGLVSVISWGVADIPQIITTYRNKSTEGVSFAFFMTWIFGVSETACLVATGALVTLGYTFKLASIIVIDMGLGDLGKKKFGGRANFEPVQF
ncbi:hypothetical protein U1Q18_013289 [Sarracenia purpurea var. burkii]